MNRKMMALIGAVMAFSGADGVGAIHSAHAAENPKFLGTDALEISPAVWEPVGNDVSPGLVDTDAAYKDFTFTADEAKSYHVQRGNTATSGCSGDAIQEDYRWIHVDAAGKELGSVGVKPFEKFDAVAGEHYVLRATLSSLKGCSYVQFAFLAVVNN